MDFGAILNAIAWFVFILYSIKVVVSLVLWNFFMTDFDRAIRTLTLSGSYLAVAISGIVLYFG